MDTNKAVRLSEAAWQKLDLLQDHHEATMGTRLPKKATLEALIHQEVRVLDLHDVEVAT